MLIETYLFKYIPHSQVESCFACLFWVHLHRKRLTRIFFKMTSTFVFRCRFEGSFDDASDALLEVQCSPDVSWSNDGAGWMMGGSRFGITVWGPVLAFSLGGAEMC